MSAEDTTHLTRHVARVLSSPTARTSTAAPPPSRRPTVRVDQPAAAVADRPGGGPAAEFGGGRGTRRHPVPVRWRGGVLPRATRTAPAAPPPVSAVDPVCGMTVPPVDSS